MCEELRGTLALVEVGTVEAAEERSGQRVHLPPQLEGILDEGSCQGGCKVPHQAGANLRLWICGHRYVGGDEFAMDWHGAHAFNVRCLMQFNEPIISHSKIGE